MGYLTFCLLSTCMSIDAHFHAHHHSNHGVDDDHVHVREHHDHDAGDIEDLMHEFVHQQKEIKDKFLESELERLKSNDTGVNFDLFRKGKMPAHLVDPTGPKNSECADGKSTTCPCGQSEVKEAAYGEGTGKYWVNDYKKNGLSVCQGRSCTLCMKQDGNRVKWAGAGLDKECEEMGYEPFKKCSTFLDEIKLHCYRKPEVDSCTRYRCPYCDLHVDTLEDKTRTVFNIECPFCKKTFKATNNTAVRLWYKNARTQRFLERYIDAQKELSEVDDEIAKAESELLYWKKQQERLAGLDLTDLMKQATNTTEVT